MNETNTVTSPPRPAWETSSTPSTPWPRGWHRAPSRMQLRCVTNGHAILAGEDLWCTGRAGECYCRPHAHLAPAAVALPSLPDLP